MPFQRNLLCRSFLWLTLSIVPFSHLAAAEPKEILLWPNGLPAGAKSLTADQIAKLKAAPVDPERISLVENPSMMD